MSKEVSRDSVASLCSRVNVYVGGSYIPKEAESPDGVRIELHVCSLDYVHADYVRDLAKWFDGCVHVSKYGGRPCERHEWSRWIDVFEPVRKRVYVANEGMINDGQIDDVEFVAVTTDQKIEAVEKAMNLVRRVRL